MMVARSSPAAFRSSNFDLRKYLGEIGEIDGEARCHVEIPLDKTPLAPVSGAFVGHCCEELLKAESVRLRRRPLFDMSRPHAERYIWIMIPSTQ